MKLLYRTNAEFLAAYSALLRRQKQLGLDIAEAPANVQESALRLHQAALWCSWEETLRKKTLKKRTLAIGSSRTAKILSVTLEQYYRWPVVCLQTVRAQSGRVFIAEGEQAYMECSAQYTCWIYDQPEGGTLLCTLNQEHKPWKVFAIVEEQ